MATLQDAQTWVGMKMVDPDDDTIGTIEDIYLDRDTGQPEWATVRTGLFGTKVSFVPIRDAQKAGDDEIRVPFQKDQVKDAPRIEADGELSPDEERQLYEYYGRADYDQWTGEDRTTALGLPEEQGGRFARPGAGAEGEAGAAGEAGAPGEAGAAGEAGAPIVGVRLRRVVVVTGEPGEPGAPPDRP